MLEGLYRVLQKAGCFVDAERAVPCLYRVSNTGVVTEAILDVVMSIPGGLATSYFDLTIRITKLNNRALESTNMLIKT